jgi:hypothetical protein
MQFLQLPANEYAKCLLRNNLDKRFFSLLIFSFCHCMVFKEKLQMGANSTMLVIGPSKKKLQIRAQKRGRLTLQ